MASSDRDPNAVKIQDGQVSFEGGMNWIDAPNELQPNESRFLLNVDVRRKDLEKAKGQRPFSEVEIGAEFYDRFFTTELDGSKWLGITDDALAVISITAEFELSLVDARVAPTFDSFGVISSRTSPTATLSYTEFEVTTPSSTTSNNFLAVLSDSSTAFDQTKGIGVQFTAGGNIEKVEDGVRTDTTIDWVVDTTYRIRIEKKATGWKCFLLNLTTDSKTAVSLFDTSFVGEIIGFLQFQVNGGTWLVDDVVYHEGFGALETRNPATGIVRFYRESAFAQLIVFAFGTMFRYEDATGYVPIRNGFDIFAKMSFEIFNDELFCTNGVDKMIRYDGLNIFSVGAGETEAPRAQFIQSHLSTLFTLQKNTLFRSKPGNVNIWLLDTVTGDTQLEVDVDAWNGDTGAGLIKLGANLYIIKTSSVWVLSGTLNDNFILQRIPGTKGCVAPYSIATDGQIAFWRGIDGVYKFDGRSTQLVSYRIHPAFNEMVKSPFPTTVFTQKEESVGVIHDYKYRLAVAQHVEGGDISVNNYEYVLDFLTNSGRGAWYSRDNRNVNMYAVFNGREDSNELLFVSSDSTNMLFEAEVLDGNLRSDYTSITINDIADTSFVGKWRSRNLIAKGTTRDFLDKTWNPIRVLYSPKGKYEIGIKLGTRNNVPEQLLTFQIKRLKNSGSFARELDGTNFKLDGTSSLADAFVEETFKKSFKFDIPKNVVPDNVARGNAVKGVEGWLEITQAQEVRTAAKTTPTGLRASPGNFEPFRITRVLLGIQEENSK